MSGVKHREKMDGYRNQSVTELADAIRAAQKRLGSLRFDHALRKHKNISDISTSRKSIAVLKTILQEKIAASTQLVKESQ